MFNNQTIKNKYSKTPRWALVSFASIVILLSCLGYKYSISALDSSRAWNVPAIDLKMALLNKYSNAYNYTIFDTDKVVFRSKTELAELYTATELDIRELVALKPERLLLHEVIVQTLTRWRWNTPDELQSQIKVVMNNLGQTYQMKKLSVDSIIYRQQLTKTLDNNESIDLSLIKESYIPGKYINRYSVKQAAIDLQVDFGYKKYIEPKIKNLVTGYYDQLFRNKPETKITMDPLQRPHTIIMAGGPASGKTTYGRLMQSKLTHDGVDWRDVVKINTDTYKELLKVENFENPDIYYSQLVQPEAQIISNYRLKARIGELIKQKKVQHIFWDQVLMDPIKIQWGLMHNGVVSIHIVSTDIVNSIQRSYLRGKLTGRYESTEMILNFHKRVTYDMPYIINNFSGKNVYISLLDNNVAQDSVTKIFEVFAAQKYAVVYDADKLINFISKRDINQKAKSVRDLDLSINSVKLADYFSLLTANGYTIVNKS